MPSKHDIDLLKWTKWASIGTVASAIIAFLALYKPDARPYVIETTIIPEAERPAGGNDKTRPSGSHQQAATPVSTPEPEKKENLWNGQLTNQVKQILAEKGFSSNMNVSGSLVLSAPQKMENDRLRYILTLTIDIFRPASKKACGQLVYSCPVMADATYPKDQIIDQAMEGKGGVIEQLEQETNLPTCELP